MESVISSIKDDTSSQFLSGKKRKKEERSAETTNHSRMYTLAQRILGGAALECVVISGGKVPFLDVIIPLGIRGAAL